MNFIDAGKIKESIPEKVENEKTNSNEKIKNQSNNSNFAFNNLLTAVQTHKMHQIRRQTNALIKN